MPIADVRQLAASLDIHPTSGVKKNDLVYRILQETVGKRGLMFGEGVLEVLPDGFGFLRSPDYSYLPSPDDIYLSAPLISEFGLKTGLVVGGQLQPPQENERHFSLLRVEQIEAESPENFPALSNFDDLTALHPDRHLRLSGGENSSVATRIIDLLSPIGFGQRGLIVAPPRAGKTVLLQEMARSITANHPDAVLMVLLIDERPEEVTDMARRIDGEVVASTFDEPPSRHVQVAEMVLEKAKRLVEFGYDVVILLDSITRLGRAYNAEIPTTGKVLTGGVDASALQKPKQFFGAARNVEGGGSLTVLSTALIETGSRMDEVIFEEFKGTGNMELVLDRRLSEQRLFPAVDPHRSGTRMEERLLSPQDLRLSWILRQVFAGMNSVEAMQLLIEKVRATENNEELLASMSRSG